MIDYFSKCGRLLKRLKRPCWKRGRRVKACVGSNPMSSVYNQKKIPKKSWESFLYVGSKTRVNFLEDIKQQFHIEDGQDNGNNIT